MFFVFGAEGAEFKFQVCHILTAAGHSLNRLSLGTLPNYKLWIIGNHVYFNRMFTKISANGTISKLTCSNYLIIGYLSRSIHNTLATIQKSRIDL